MSIVLYFSTKSLIFTNKPSVEHALVYTEQPPSRISLAKVLTFFENYNTIELVSDDFQASFVEFSKQFELVEAAGGVLRTPRNQVLMIRRRGNWDLPKGCLEAGESPEVGALREVEEETGIRPDGTLRYLTHTLHAYNTYGRWQLKHTSWYEMRIPSSRRATPQAEEEITEALWMSLKQARLRASGSYPTLVRVIAALPPIEE